MRYLLALCLFLIIPAHVQAQADQPPQDGEIFVRASGKALLGDRTEEQAKAIALNNARRNAIEEAVGIKLHSSSLIYNGELVSELVSAAAKGLIVKEIVNHRCGAENGQLYCLASIEAYVKPLKESASNLKVLKATVQRPGKETVQSPVFQNNDEVQVSVTVNEDAYISIFSVDQHGSVIRLLPNEYVKTGKVQARNEFVFPDEKLRIKGLKFRVVTKMSSVVESALIIATKEDPHFLEEAENPTITDLMNELSRLDTPWAEKTVGYEVRR